jgi:predicted Zn-dependent protease
MRQTAVTSSTAPGWKVRARAAIAPGIAALVAAATALSPALTFAQGGRVAIVRDAEAEALLYDYMRPLLKAAGVQRPDVLLVPSPEFNAFVTGLGNVFVNVGAIVDSETPNELIGVLAHEIGHIAANDVAHMTQQLEDTKLAMTLAGLVGLGAAVAGAATGSQGAGQVGAGIMTGALAIGQGSILRYQREKESAADRAAMKYLNATGQSGAGMLATLQRLADQTLLSSRGINPYLQSHPLPRERVIEIQSLLSQSQYTGRTDPAELQLRHDLLRAKLVGFTWETLNVMRRYPISDNSLAARYARAIVAYRTGKPGPAIEQIDGLIKSAPNNPYFYELKGQALLETGNPKAAVAPFRKAVSLAPNSNLLKIILGQALVATDDRSVAPEAIKLLSAAMQGDPDVSTGYRALARAYALVDDIGMAQLATAQGYFAEGNYKEARMQAERAQAKLKAGSPAWLRADDILNYKPPKS